jgi:hypothetical protein
MMIFPTSMRPEALGNTSRGRVHSFTCDICSTSGEGRYFTAKGKEKEDWAVLPDDWNEVEDRRPNMKKNKKFLIVCVASECQHRAEEFKNGATV